MGGIAIAIGTAIGFAMIALRPDSLKVIGDPGAWLPVVLAAAAMFGVGVLDDRLQLSPLAKLVASLAIGAFLVDRKSTRLNSSHVSESRMPSSA